MKHLWMTAYFFRTANKKKKKIAASEITIR